MYDSNNQEFKPIEPDKDLQEILNNNVQGRPLFDLSFEEINDISSKIDAKNSQDIDEYFKKGIIDEYTANVLHKNFDNSMANYDALYTAVTESLGEPEDICYFNIETGELDNNNSYYLQHVAPFTSMALKYTDNHKNTFYVKLGKVKSLKRVLEKIMPGSLYDRDYHGAVKKAWEKHGDNSALYLEEVAKIPKPIDRVSDIFRCIHEFKYVQNIYDNIGNYKKNTNLEIRESEIKDKYCGNKIVGKDKEETEKLRDDIMKNPGGHRDFKFIVRFPNGLKGEFMGMTRIFGRAYKKTHAPYEIRRRIEFDMPYKKTYAAIESARLDKLDCNIQIRNANAQGFEEENMLVLDKVKRMEDKARRQKRLPDESGTYPECAKFIEDNFYVRTLHALTDSSFDNMSGPLRDVSCRYFPYIRKKYIADMSNFQTKADPQNITKIDQIFAARKAELNVKPSKNELSNMQMARSDAEYETLSAMDRGEVLSAKNQKSLPKVNNTVLRLQQMKSSGR